MHFDKEYGNLVLRISLGIVFLYFASQQMLNPDQWAGFVPSFLTGTVISAQNLVIFNSILELSLGTFLIAGLYTRTSALILGVHLIGIFASIGINPVGVRDFGLAFATLSIFLHGKDRWTLDHYFEIKKEKVINS